MKFFRCKKSAHYASQCQSKASDKKETRGEQSGHATFATAFNTLQSTKDYVDWIFDSGAKTPLYRNRGHLKNAMSISTSINLANSTAAAVIAKGAVNLEADIGGSSCEITMSNVLSVPDLALNLIYLGKMCQNGYQITFDKDSCKVVSATNEVVVIGQYSDGL